MCRSATGPIGGRRVTPATPVAIDGDDSALHPTIIHLGLAVALGEVRSPPRLLLVRQPIQVADIQFLAEPESDREHHINGS